MMSSGTLPRQASARQTSARQTSDVEQSFVTRKVRALIAEHLGIGIEFVTADTHFTDDLGIDRLDVLELMIVIEDQFVDVEIPDEADEMEFVGDLIRQIEMVDGCGPTVQNGRASRLHVTDT